MVNNVFVILDIYFLKENVLKILNLFPYVLLTVTLMEYSVHVMKDIMRFSQKSVLNAQIIPFGMVICAGKIKHVKQATLMIIVAKNVFLLVSIVDRTLNGME